MCKKNVKKFYSIGLMSGTSMDGIDASLIQTDGFMIYDYIVNCSIDYPVDIKVKLKEASEQFHEKNISWADIHKLKRSLSDLNLFAVNKLLEKNTALSLKVDLIGYHGQTVYHSPSDKISIQLGDPKYLSNRTKIPVIFNFRICDILNGGQGAPLTPIYHAARFSKTFQGPIAVVNIGGISNMTYIDRECVIAFDTGPGNCLIDDMMTKYFSKEFDDEGRLALQGDVDDKFLTTLMSDEFFNRTPPKSLDRNYFHKYLKSNEKSPQNLISTLSYFTANTIVDAMKYFPSDVNKIIICGGGSKNKYITQKISELSKKEVITSDSIGISSRYIESEAFAYLAVRCLLNLHISYPTTTGIQSAMSGGSIFRPIG